MSEDKTRKNGSAAQRKSGSSGGKQKLGSKSGSTKSTSPGTGSKSGSTKSTSPGTGSKSGSAKNAAPATGSKNRSTKSTSSGTGSKSGTAKNSSAKTGTARTASSRSGQSKAAYANKAGRRASDDLPRNPRRDSEDERNLHNSPNAKRLAEERRRKKYNKNRRAYSILFYMAIAVAVLSVIFVLSVTVLFNISEITVERGKNVTYTDEEILAACGVETGDNLFAIDLDRVALDVTTQLPYIEVCNISRRLPSTLALDVHSAVVLGSVTTTDGKYIVLSASGRALEFADGYTGTKKLTHLNGMDVTFGGVGSPAQIPDPGKLDAAAELVVGFSLYNLSLDSITFDNDGAVTADYDSRIKIRFGVPTNLSEKIQITAGMITEGKIARNESGILDLSIAGTAVFTPDYLLKDEE